MPLIMEKKNVNYLWLAIAISIVCASSVSGANPEFAPFRSFFGGQSLEREYLAKAGKDYVKPDQKLVDLGKLLYFDKRLSIDNSISCNSCHDLKNYGVDGKRYSEGVNGHLTTRNSPTTLNAFMHAWQFWDGRVDTVEEQAKGPILAEGEMGMMTAQAIEKKIAAIKGYQNLFNEIFSKQESSVTLDNITKAIGAFERTLLSPSRFDDFQEGDDNALTKDEIRGMQKFQDYTCFQCHYEPLVGGYSMRKLGIMEPWKDQSDLGVYEWSRVEDQKMEFKVPSLRNVAKTAPYFHDGSVPTLREAIQLMGKHQLGRDISDEDADSITVFLNALTGILDPNIAEAPKTFPQ